MEKPDIQRYCDLMVEIKARMKVIDFFLSGSGYALYMPTTIESVSLQLRKVLELIAMGSLIANKAEYSKVYADFAKNWNAKYLLRDLARVNPEFYPKPVIETPSEEPGIKSKLMNREDDYLTKADFVKVYEKCGAIMHSDNPFGSKVDYKYYERKLPEWRRKIINLLNSHKIQLFNSQGFYLIHMKEDQDDKVHYYEFTLVLESNHS